MEFLDRHLVIVFAKQGFLKWIKKIDPKRHKWTIDHLNNDPAAYLIEVEDQNCFGLSLEEVHYREIIENELSLLYIDRKYWPDKLDYKLFSKWFTYSYHSEVYDLLSNDNSSSNSDQIETED